MGDKGNETVEGGRRLTWDARCPRPTLPSSEESEAVFLYIPVTHVRLSCWYGLTMGQSPSFLFSLESPSSPFCMENSYSPVKTQLKYSSLGSSLL